MYFMQVGLPEMGISCQNKGYGFIAFFTFEFAILIKLGLSKLIKVSIVNDGIFCKIF